MEVRLPSNISEHWLWRDPVRFLWWILLLQNVAEEDKNVCVNGVKVKCRKGQLITTQSTLAKLWHTSTPTAQGFIRKLEQMGEISRKVDAKLTQITVCNIEDWEYISRNIDAKLTQEEGDSRKVDAKLTQINSNDSDNYEENRRKVDAKLTQIEKEKRNEKESFPPHPPYKEKENKKEKELGFTDVKPRGPADADHLGADPDCGIDFKKLRQFFNEQMKGKMIPPIRAILNKRRTAVLARSKEYGKKSIMDAIVNAANSSFLNGKNKRNFVASFDWIFCPNNFPKVLENNYSDVLTNQITTTDGSTNQNFRPQHGFSASDEKQQRDAEFAAHIAEKIARAKKQNGS